MESNSHGYITIELKLSVYIHLYYAYIEGILSNTYIDRYLYSTVQYTCIIHNNWQFKETSLE